MSELVSKYFNRAFKLRETIKKEDTNERLYRIVLAAVIVATACKGL
ncbi:5624_t:CDS:2 [Rhizophagus irregularis]|nr:5624_t:CDS:2 [Rhizophagus irregularis]